MGWYRLPSTNWSCLLDKRAFNKFVDWRELDSNTIWQFTSGFPRNVGLRLYYEPQLMWPKERIVTARQRSGEGNYRPQRKGNGFRSVCQSFCPQGRVEQTPPWLQTYPAPSPPVLTSSGSHSSSRYTSYWNAFLCFHLCQSLFTGIIHHTWPCPPPRHVPLLKPLPFLCGL